MRYGPRSKVHKCGLKMNDFHEKKNLITICYTLPINHFSDLNFLFSKLKSFNHNRSDGNEMYPIKEMPPNKAP